MRIAANRRSPVTEETKEKIRKSRKTQVITEETKEKISKANKGRPSPKGFLGKTHSIEERERITLRNLARGGHSEETKERIREAAKNRPKLLCPKCLKEFDPANYKRYHGEKCKQERLGDQHE